jgi:hypothetical protein
VDAPPELAALIMKALAKKREKRYQSCQELLVDLNRLRQRYSLQAPVAVTGEAAIPGPANALDAAPAAADMSAEPAEAGTPATEDTVDYLPVPSLDDEETVTLSVAPTWGKRIAGRIDSAISGAIARLGRPSTATPIKETGTRKR